MLFSGELSMTTSPELVPLAEPVAVDVLPPPVDVDEPVEPDDEQAASVAARRPAAVSAAALLLAILLIVNSDLPSRGY
jgi:hypothetical protein